MRTNSLRKLIKERLDTLGHDVYYAEAKTDALYPHIVFDLRSINIGDLHRSDYRLIIDVWDEGHEYYNVEDIADKVVDLLQAKNLPQTDILPTFYSDNRAEIEDDVKTIKHIQITFTVQLYVK